MRKKCGLVVEFFLGLGTVLLIASCFLFLLTLPEGQAERPFAPRFDVELRRMF